MPRFLIVGQGLAGSVLALELLSRGADVTVMEAGLPGRATPVAAGMFNPMSFRRILPVWRADEVMPAMERFYTAAETALGARFFHRVPLVKLFPNADYAALWQQRIDEGLPWISKASELPTGAVAPHGGGLVASAGYVDLPVFVGAVSSRLSADGRRVERMFNEDLLHLSSSGVTYVDPSDGFRFEGDGVIMATGTFARGSRRMAGLPLQTNKGEVLTVSTADFASSVTLNNGKWLLPVGDGRFRLGASYLPGATDDLPTDAVCRQLLEKAAAMVEADFTVLEHRAGLRPTVTDHRALLGAVNNEPVYHFNGLGTRGVLNVPLLARWMADYLLNGQALPEEVGVGRFHIEGKFAPIRF